MFTLKIEKKSKKTHLHIVVLLNRSQSLFFEEEEAKQIALRDVFLFFAAVCRLLSDWRISI